MTTEARGLWTLHEAIQCRWNDAGLDAAFRAVWTNPTYTHYPTLHDTEAPPNSPGPFCVYEIMEPVVEGHHGGKTSTTERQIQRATVRFHVRAENSATETGKIIAQRLAKLVAAAFDPGRGALRIGPDAHVKTHRGPDWCVREGPEVWTWALQYDFFLDCAYTTPA